MRIYPEATPLKTCPLFLPGPAVKADRSKVQLISGIYLAAPRADAAFSGSCGKLE